MQEVPNPKNQEKSIEEQEADLLRRFLDNIRTRMKDIPEKKEERELKKILKEYGINQYELDWRDEKDKEKKGGFLRTARNTALVAGAAVGLVTTSGLFQTKKKNQNPVETEQVVNKPKDSEKKDTTAVEINQRFKMEVYSSLTPEGKDVYTYFANYNPTPGRGYMMLDKENAIQYIFNDKNEIVAKITAGFGKDVGDENNTSYKSGVGKTTTPSGAYVISNATDSADVKKYGPLQYSIVKSRANGGIEYLGIHKTYPEQLKERTEKLLTPTPGDNKFSDGCINISEEDFENKVKRYFQGDGGEIIVILPDQASRNSGAKFQIDLSIKKALEMIIDMSYKQEKVVDNLLPQMKTEDGYKKMKAKKEMILIKRARAEKILSEGK